MERRRGVVGASSRLQWSAPGAAMERCRGRWSSTATAMEHARGFNGVPPESLELCRGCNGASRGSSTVLHRSFFHPRLVVSLQLTTCRSIGVGAVELCRCCIGPPELHRCCIETSALRWCCKDAVLKAERRAAAADEAEGARWSSDEASAGPSELQRSAWCNESPPELQRSAAGVALKHRRSCNKACRSFNEASRWC